MPRGGDEQAPLQYIVLKQGVYETEPTFFRFANVFGVLGAIEFALSSALVALGIASVALADEYLQPGQYAIDITDPANIDRFNHALALIKIGAPVWSGIVLMLTASIGLYTVYVPGTVDSLKLFLVMSVTSMLVLLAETAILTVLIYEMAYEVKRKTIINGGMPAKIDLGFESGALFITLISILCLLFTSGLGCANVCKCGQIYILMDEEAELEMNSKKAMENALFTNKAEFVDPSQMANCQASRSRYLSTAATSANQGNSNAVERGEPEPMPSCSRQREDSTALYPKDVLQEGLKTSQHNNSTPVSITLHDAPVRNQL